MKTTSQQQQGRRRQYRQQFTAVEMMMMIIIIIPERVFLFLFFVFVFFLIPAAWSFWLVLPFLLLLFIIAENCYLFGHKSGGDSGSFLFEGIIIFIFFIFFLLIVCLGISSNVSRCISRVVAGGVR